MHKFTLEPYKGMNTRYHCPRCQHREKTFTLYIDTETGNYINQSVGRCNREINCGYHYTPKQYFFDNNVPQPKVFKPIKPRLVIPEQKPFSFIPIEIFKASLKAHKTNHFVQYLIKIFGVEITSHLVNRYFIATSKKWDGATVFWQIDTKFKVRTGKIMLYNPKTGKRVKKSKYINWAHRLVNQSDYILNQCLFGEHLLVDNTKPIAVVESEKTAIIASVYFPEFVWVAVGGLSNLTEKMCTILKGRKVFLYPDVNGFEKWKRKADELSNIASFTVSDLLERIANNLEREQGLDIADYLIRFPLQESKTP